MAYSYQQLMALWVQNGGPSAVAPLMAAIGLAESSGNPAATNADSGACGLWQINPPEPGCSDPNTNAQMAVRKYNEQGLSAWQAYTQGTYQRYYQPGAQPSSAYLASAATGSSPSCCVHGFPLFGSTFCMDVFIGFGLAAVGVGAGVVAVVLLSGVGGPVAQVARSQLGLAH